jgi:hypothetical protein
MAVVDQLLSHLDARAVLEAAATQGFELFHFETPEGYSIWEWRRASEPRPQFVTRRVALVWMCELLGRELLNRESAARS